MYQQNLTTTKSGLIYPDSYGVHIIICYIFFHLPAKPHLDPGLKSPVQLICKTIQQPAAAIPRSVFI